MKDERVEYSEAIRSKVIDLVEDWQQDGPMT